MNRRKLLAGLSLLALGTINTASSRALAQSVLGTPAINPLPAPPQTTNLQATNLQAAKLDDTPAPGLKRLVLMRWGDPLLPDAPPFNPHPLTPDQADSQFAYDGVIAGLITPPLSQDQTPRLVMVLVNPTAPARMVFPPGADHPKTAGKLQGATILCLQFQAGRWVTEQGGYQSRRLTDGTLCQISGPAAAAIGTSVQGLLAAQAGCATQWGSVLFAEGHAAPWLTRLTSVGYGYADPAQAPKFGWVVELNPLDPGAIPIKRTALGRFAKSGIAATQTPDGRAVVFISHDAPAGYLFRFISTNSMDDPNALDSGTLAVAQVNENAIIWRNLPADSASLVGALNSALIAEGSVFDAPAGLALGAGGSLYLACQGNPARSALNTNPLNPRAGDDNGYVLALHAPSADYTATSFTAEIAIAAGNPLVAPGTQYTAGSSGWLRHPRTLAVDPLGQLWIGTDSGGDTSESADGLFIMQTAGPSKYLISNAYFAPTGAAMGGTGFDATSRTSFAMVRHPGATPQASFNQPATRWPTLNPALPPQSTLISLTQV